MASGGSKLPTFSCGNKRKLPGPGSDMQDEAKRTKSANPSYASSTAASARRMTLNQRPLGAAQSTTNPRRITMGASGSKEGGAPSRTRTTSQSSLEGNGQASGAKPKRAKWDTKGRLDDLEQEMKTRRDIEKSLRDQIELLQSTNEHLDVKVKSEAQVSTQYMQELTDVKDQLRAMTTELSVTAARRDALEIDLSRARTTISTLTTEKMMLEEKNNQLLLENGDVKAKLERVTKLNEICMQEKVTLLEEKHQLVEEKGKMEEGWRKSETERRILQNQVLELKGNVRVFCRLRPPLGNEPPEITAFQTPGPCEITCFPPGAKSISFTFDRVLNQHIQQEEAFEEVSALVQTALDGYKVCVFAYGQTGSGKTYTMEGDIDGPNRGIIPRATDQIFDTIEELKARDWSYEVKVSILEVYNEKFTDLINPDENGKGPEIYADPTTKEPVFVNLYRATVEKPSEVQTLIRRAQRRRHVAATKCNERSSRSHCVFWMQFSGKNSATEETTAGSVYLVDLAGSERSKVSGATGTRLKETNDINVSLSALGRVFVSIMAKDSHIPYRDSKLTQCLQPCLGGSAKVLMMVNLSPFDVNESLNTLRFAKKVNQCHIGTARKRC